MVKIELKGERKWTQYIKSILDKEFKNTNYRVTCDTDREKYTVNAVVSLNKFLRMYNNTDKNKEISIKDFTNNEFHPDILIEEEIKSNDKSYYIPRLMIESKYYKSSDVLHEILAYNYKADLHKKLYSGLRYGLIIGNRKYVTDTTIRFGNNFDFILALKDQLTTKEKKRFIEVVKKNLVYASQLESLLDGPIKKKEILCVGIENNIIFDDNKKK